MSIAELRKNDRAVMLEVLQQLGWTEQEYCNFKYEMGIGYLHAKHGNDTEIIEAMAATRSFWGWWRLHWTDRDEVFIATKENIGREYEREIYHDMHDPKSLLDDLTVNGALMEDVYSNMVGNFNKEIKVKAV